MEENRDNVPTQETNSNTNLRRRTRYAQMSPERKQLFLSQLREKRAESKRQKTYHQSNSTAALTITTSSLSAQQVTASKPTNVPCTSTRREHIVRCLSTFQLEMEENTDNVSAPERTSDRNLQRRTRYAQMPPKRKGLFLSQLREKRVESKRQKILHQSNSTGALTIITSSLSPQQVPASEPTNLPVTSTGGQCIVNCLSTFEVGSTSTASQTASKLRSRCIANRGYFPYFNDLVGREVTVKFKSDFAIGRTLHSVHQYVNIKLQNTTILHEDNYPHIDMHKKNEQLKNEEAQVKAKFKMYLEKFKDLETGVSIQDMQKKNQELKNEEAQVKAKLKMYLEKFKDLETGVSIQEEQAAKNRAVDVSLIQQTVENLEAKDDHVVEVNSKASGADGDLQEKQLSPPMHPLAHSTANGNGNGNAK